MPRTTAGSLRRVPLVLFVLGIAGLAACRAREEPNLDPPDSLLQDSLGLTAADHVHRVVLSSQNGSESMQPTELTIEPGHYVEFFTEDGRVRTVSFVLEGLTPAQSQFLRSTAQDRSPPLVELGSRYVVSFTDAPPGRYPFRVEGNERTIQGIVSVQGPERDR
jgi:plastocyanin